MSRVVGDSAPADRSSRDFCGLYAADVGCYHPQRYCKKCGSWHQKFISTRTAAVVSGAVGPESAGEKVKTSSGGAPGLRKNGYSGVKQYGVRELAIWAQLKENEVPNLFEEKKRMNRFLTLFLEVILERSETRSAP